MDITEKIKELREELEKLEKRQKVLENLPVDIRLAEQLHEKLCHHNHTDMCDWFYGTWENPLYARTEYLNKAQRCLKVTDIDTCLKIVNALT